MGEQPKARGVPPGSWLISSGGFSTPPSEMFKHLPIDELLAPTRAQRFRQWRRYSINAAREWAALKIAPWLDPDDFL